MLKRVLKQDLAFIRQVIDCWAKSSQWSPKVLFFNAETWWWWHTPVVAAPEKQRQEGCRKLETSLVCLVSPGHIGLQSKTLSQKP